MHTESTNMSSNPTSGSENKPSASRGKAFLSSFKSVGKALNEVLNPVAIYKQGKAEAKKDPGSVIMKGTAVLLFGGAGLIVGAGGLGLAALGASQLPFSPVSGAVMLVGGLAVAGVAFVMGGATVFLGAALVKEGIASAIWKKQNPKGSQMRASSEKNQAIAKDISAKLQASNLDEKVVKKAQAKLTEIGDRRIKSAQEDQQALADMTLIVAGLGKHTDGFKQLIVPIQNRIEELSGVEITTTHAPHHKIAANRLRAGIIQLPGDVGLDARNKALAQLEEIANRPIDKFADEMKALDDMNTVMLGLVRHQPKESEKLKLLFNVIQEARTKLTEQNDRQLGIS